MKFFVTGGGGFIGSSMVDFLLDHGNEVVAFDNFSTGQREFLKIAEKNNRFKFIEADVLDLKALTQAMSGCEFVFHFQANADVRFGLNHPGKDIEQNIQGTFHVLEAMRANGIKEIAFSSTGSVYGESAVIPTPENAPFPIQTSLYATSKITGEGLISSYCEGFGFQGWIFRFVSILGERYTHGHVFDFYRKLRANPHEIDILGNGKQRKSYLYIKDCLQAIWLAIHKAQDKVNLFNLGTDEYCEVNNSLSWICQELGLNPKRQYTGGERGWVGDNPFIFLETKKIRDLGWRPQLTIEQAVRRTLQYLVQNSHLLDQVK